MIIIIMVMFLGIFGVWQSSFAKAVDVGSTLVDRRNKAMKFFIMKATFSGTI